MLVYHVNSDGADLHVRGLIRGPNLHGPLILAGEHVEISETKYAPLMIRANLKSLDVLSGSAADT